LLPQASLGAFPSTVWKNWRWGIHESTPQPRVKNTVKRNSKWESARKSSKNRRLFPGANLVVRPALVLQPASSSWERAPFSDILANNQGKVHCKSRPWQQTYGPAWCLTMFGIFGTHFETRTPCRLHSHNQRKMGRDCHPWQNKPHTWVVATTRPWAWSCS